MKKILSLYVVLISFLLIQDGLLMNMKNMAKDSTKTTLLEDLEEIEEEHGSDDSETENSKVAHFANISINNYLFLLAQKEEIIFSNCGLQEVHLELPSPPPRFS
jgi:hypothetical protein